jgi:CheY-like chemotaxis protein
VELHALLAEISGLLAGTTQGRIRIESRFLPEPAWILGDAGNLSGALMNLGVNAADAMPGGGTLTFLTSCPEPGWVEVAVLDTGQGMAPETLARAIEPFFTTKEVGQGTGLGLSMVHGVVQAHGGSMELSSEPGLGTAVRLRFPRIPAPAAGPRDAPGPGPGGLRVLLVDDDEDVLHLTGRMLRKAGHHPQVARGGAEALALLDGGAAPDVVILDLNMPRMDGQEAAERIRALRPGLPILISTGRLDAEDWECFRRPDLAVLPKPFTLDELQARLERLRAQDPGL